MGRAMDYAIIGGLLVCSLFLLQSARWFLTDRGMTSGVLAAIFGLGTLAATIVYVAPALLDTEKVKLAEQVSALTKETSTLKSDKVKLEADAKRFAAEQTASANRLTDLERKRVAELDSVLTGLDDVRGRLNASSAGVVVDRPYFAGNADPDERVRGELRALSDFRVRQAAAIAAPPPPPVPEPPRELTQLKDKMSARLSTPNYDVEVYPDKELVKGRQGRYYVVDLKNATSGIRYFFGGGKYTLGLGNPEFRTSLNTFIGDILAKFEGKVRYDLFVRGNADAKPYQGPFEPGYEFRTIKYVRSLGNDKYGVDTSERSLGSSVRNEDLPDMRAAFMQKVITEAYPLKAPTILQGSVTSKTDDGDRNAELILYVDW